jgi:hypothetical protein
MWNAGCAGRKLLSQLRHAALRGRDDAVATDTGSAAALYNHGTATSSTAISSSACRCAAKEASQ